MIRSSRLRGVTVFRPAQHDLTRPPSMVTAIPPPAHWLSNSFSVWRVSQRRCQPTPTPRGVLHVLSGHPLATNGRRRRTLLNHKQESNNQRTGCRARASSARNHPVGRKTPPGNPEGSSCDACYTTVETFSLEGFRASHKIDLEKKGRPTR